MHSRVWVTGNCRSVVAVAVAATSTVVAVWLPMLSNNKHASNAVASPNATQFASATDFDLKKFWTPSVI